MHENIEPGWRRTDEAGREDFDYTLCGIRYHGHRTWVAWVARSEDELRQACVALFDQRYPTDADKNEACREQGNSRGVTVRWMVGTGVCGEPIPPVDMCSQDQ